MKTVTKEGRFSRRTSVDGRTIAAARSSNSHYTAFFEAVESLRESAAREIYGGLAE